MSINFVRAIGLIQILRKVADLGALRRLGVCPLVDRCQEGSLTW